MHTWLHLRNHLYKHACLAICSNGCRAGHFPECVTMDSGERQSKLSSGTNVSALCSRYRDRIHATTSWMCHTMQVPATCRPGFTLRCMQIRPWAMHDMRTNKRIFEPNSRRNKAPFTSNTRPPPLPPLPPLTGPMTLELIDSGEADLNSPRLGHRSCTRTSALGTPKAAYSTSSPDYRGPLRNHQQGP